jgi:hypothetical protein
MQTEARRKIKNQKSKIKNRRLPPRGFAITRAWQLNLLP